MDELMLKKSIYILLFFLFLLAVVNFAVEKKDLVTSLIIITSAALSGLIIVTVVSKIINDEINAYNMALLGYGFFGVLDIARYLMLDQARKALDPDIQEMTILFLLVSFLCFLISYRLFKFKVNDKFYNTQSFSVKKYSIWLVPVSLALAIYFLFTWKNYFLNNQYFFILGYFLKAFMLLTLFIYYKTNKRIFLIAFIVMLISLMTDTSRRAYVTVLIPAIALYINNLNGKKSLTIANKALFIGMIGLLFIFLNFMRSEHDFGSGFVKGNRYANTKEYILTLKSLDTFYNTGFIVQNFPRNYSFYYGKTYLSVMVGLIPRSIWPSKPVGLGAPLGLMQKTGRGDFSMDAWIASQRFSLSPGFVGEGYANWGVIGVVLTGILLGASAKYFDRKIRYNGGEFTLESLPYIVFLPAFLLMGRGDFYVSLNYSIFISFFLFVFVQVIRNSSPQKLTDLVLKPDRQE